MNGSGAAFPQGRPVQGRGERDPGLVVAHRSLLLQDAEQLARWRISRAELYCDREAVCRNVLTLGEIHEFSL